VRIAASDVDGAGMDDAALADANDAADADAEDTSPSSAADRSARTALARRSRTSPWDSRAKATGITASPTTEGTPAASAFRL
jgi:hypothetical protein